MNTRKLFFGLATLLIVAGLLLALFAPGGLANSGIVHTMQTPFGSLSVTESRSSSWPIIGYVMIGLGGVAAVVGFALKSSPQK